jgi:hypothetical protein
MFLHNLVLDEFSQQTVRTVSMAVSERQAGIQSFLANATFQQHLPASAYLLQVK